MLRLKTGVLFLAFASYIQCFDPYSAETKADILSRVNNISELFQSLVSEMAFTSVIAHLPEVPQNINLKCLKLFDFDSVKQKYQDSFNEIISKNSTLVHDSVQKIEEANAVRIKDEGNFLTKITAEVNFVIKVFEVCDDAYNTATGMERIQNLRDQTHDDVQAVVDNVNKCMADTSP